MRTITMALALTMTMLAFVHAGENAIRPTARPATNGATDGGEEIFSRESNLMAFFRCRNLENVDGKIENLLGQLHPRSPIRQPLKLLFGTAVFNDGLRSIRSDTWVEAVLFSLPLEPDNDWVYALRSTGEKSYLDPLLELGTIRREATEDSITRLRQTRDEVFSTFFITFTRGDIILLGRCRAAVDRARKLYATCPDEGVFYAFSADLSLSFHFNRYLLAKPRAIKNLMDEIQLDVVRDLAGSQYKQDNPLNLALGRGLESISELAREAAVADLALNLSEKDVQADFRFSGRYGGSLHYALANLPPASPSPANFLPANTTAFTGGVLWPEQYGQFLDGIVKAVRVIFGKDTPPEAVKAGADFYKLLRECGPESYVSGLINPTQAQLGYGPAFVSIIKWKKPAKLGELWDRGVDLLTIGPLSELLAEHGIKFEITTDQDRPATGGWRATRTTYICRSTYFSMPGVLAKPQTLLAATEGDFLVLALPAAPLSIEQLRAQEPFMLDLMAGVLSRLPAAAGKMPGQPDVPGLTLSAGTPTHTAPPGLPAALTAPYTGALWYASANPLAYLQTAFLCEAVWPQPAEPNRLPIPWKGFSEEFSRFPAASAPGRLILNGTPERVQLRFEIPTTTLVELAAACLNFSVPAPKE